MSPLTCGRCGVVEPSKSHYGSPVCRARRFIRSMERRGFTRIPARRWTRALRKAGAPVVHGPVSVTRTGNWVPKEYLTALVEHRKREEFQRLPFHLQVAAVVWWVQKGPNSQHRASG